MMIFWLRDPDSNRKSPGYGPGEMPFLHPAPRKIQLVGSRGVASRELEKENSREDCLHRKTCMCPDSSKNSPDCQYKVILVKMVNVSVNQKTSLITMRCDG